MKKLLLPKLKFIFLICLLNTQNIFAQTLTCQTTCPQAGEVFSMRTSSPVLNSAGANQIWNFAVIGAISPAPFIVSYNTATSVPASSLYPQGDLIRTGEKLNDFINTGNGGVRGVNPITSTANVNPVQIPLPFAYGNSYSETIVVTTVSGTDTFVTTTQNYFYAHGSGTLVLPSGTFPDVLAIRLSSIYSTKKNGSPYGYNSNDICVYYYSQNISHHLLYTRQHFDSGNADYGPYTEFMDQVTTGLKNEVKNESAEILVSPNPATEFVNVKLAGNTKGAISLKNSLGKQVFEQKNVEGSCSIDLSILPEGIYFISFKSDAFVINKKLVVSR